LRVSDLIQIIRPLVEAWEQGDFRPQAEDATVYAQVRDAVR
jgi:hypothetical protein